MKIAVAQINTTIGDFKGNVAKVIDRIEWAKLGGADIVVFPEMTVTGYPPKDLLEKPSFILRNMEALDKIAAKTDASISAIVGCVTVNEMTTGKGLFNSAAFLHDGEVKYIQNKILLPSYDVFEEVRYFEPGSDQDVVLYKGRKIGISVCEDIWSTAEFNGRRLYTIDPISKLADKGAEFIINISSSPYSAGKRQRRETLIGKVALKYQLPVVYANLVGGNDELIFDGCSLVVNKEGKVIREGGAFVEDAFIVDIDNLPEVPKRPVIGEVEEVYNALVLGVRDYVKKSMFEKVVIGLSGGIDSALVAAIASDALGPSNVMGITMPTRYSSKESVSYSKELANNLGIECTVIEIDEIYENYLKNLAPYFKNKELDITEENIQARIRGNILMAFSNKYGAMVLSTGNKSEVAVGYCTLYGDMAGGLGIISDVPKTYVYKLSEYVNRDKAIIPKKILTRPPSAELKPNQKDQDVLPPYEILDPILRAYVEDRLSVSAIVEMGFDRRVVKDIISRVDSNEYKRRQAPPGLKVTSKTFGCGRNHPIAFKHS